MPPLLWHGAGHCRAREEAEDAVQEVFLSLVRSRERLVGVEDLDAYLFAWLRRTAVPAQAQRNAGLARVSLADAEARDAQERPAEPRGPAPTRWTSDDTATRRRARADCAEDRRGADICPNRRRPGDQCQYRRQPLPLRPGAAARPPANARSQEVSTANWPDDLDALEEALAAFAHAHSAPAPAAGARVLAASATSFARTGRTQLVVVCRRRGGTGRAVDQPFVDGVPRDVVRQATCCHGRGGMADDVRDRAAGSRHLAQRGATISLPSLIPNFGHG